MANKFQRSVQERSQKEVQRQQIPPQNEVPQPIVHSKEPVAADTELSIRNNVADFIRRDQLRTAKNKTFYLDSEVITAIRQHAKQQGVTDSKLVNDILYQLLVSSNKKEV